MTAFTIRPARREDAEPIADVHLDARRVAMPWLPVLHSRDDAIGYFADHVLVREEVLVAEVDQQVVGFIALAANHVDHLYIAPAHQGRGIGDRLLARAKLPVAPVTKMTLLSFIVVVLFAVCCRVCVHRAFAARL